MKNFIVDIPPNLNNLIKSSGLKKQWIAEKVGITPHTLSRMLRTGKGHRRTIRAILNLIGYKGVADELS